MNVQKLFVPAVMAIALAVVIFTGVQAYRHGNGTIITKAQLAKDAATFCKARADYKAIAALAGGRLDPAPGSPRATLEVEEDAFCASLASTADAGARQ